MFLSFFLLQPATGGAPATDAPKGPGYEMFIMIGVIIVVFYFFMIRPQQKKQKAEQKLRDSLAKGDRIVTIGGIHGKIVSVEDATVLIEVDNGVKLKMEKSAVKPAPAEADDKTKKG
ncbi:MAG TPA: preprotein translocase subunit YajC [Bacteroidia bacterium]|jgi:preprotein translocase subunit YajC|nr:preprotein translocase subunit YajC [Bacteroidia bacterium]